MFKILKYAKKYVPVIVAAPLVLIIEVLIEVRIPTVMADIVDYAIPSGIPANVTSLGIKMVLMALASLCAGMTGTYLSSVGGVGFGSELRRNLFNKIQDFSFENVDEFQASSLQTRLTTDVDFIQQGLKMVVTMAIRAPFMMIAAAVVAYQINKQLFVVFAVAGPLLIIIIVILARIAMPLFKLMLTKFDGLNDRTKEYMTNIRVVKAYVREDFEMEKFSTTNRELMEASIKIESILVFLQPMMMFIVYSCIIAIMWLGGRQIMVGGMMTGELIAFISYVGQILSGLIMLAFIFLMLVRLKGSVDRINEVLSSQITLSDGTYDGQLEDGSVEFRNVSFKYAKASKDSIEDISFRIESGQTIGVIGSTGCGKSSVVQLIPRLYDVCGGEVIVGGHNVKEYRLATLRSDVAMVLQQNVLFSGTIADNLKWGNENATEQQMIEACKQAQAHDFITSFPEGYQTELGQGGVNVSGGQKQRLCIARALLRQPKIIILDDSTSAVDTQTDAAIRAALAKQLKDTTTIIIAQRVSSVMDADKVLVIDNGRVNGYDTPANLLKNNEIYREIYDTQMKGVDDYA